jgi:predicted DNA-binding ribbon-helix-helix protein
MSFWDTLEEIAAKEEMSLAKFLTTLHNEVLDDMARSIISHRFCAVLV